MLTPQFGENWGYTLGFEWKKLANELLTFGHNGDNWGYHSAFRFCQTTGDGIVILTNGDRGALLRDQILVEWENIIGENTDSEININNRQDFITITVLVIVFLSIIIVGMILGLKYSFMEFDFPHYHFKDSSRKKKALYSFRIFITVFLALAWVFLMFLLGWKYGKFSYAPIYFIWIDIAIFMSIAWSIPTSLFLHFKPLLLKGKLRK
jgi:hypothetical protein